MVIKTKEPGDGYIFSLSNYIMKNAFTGVIVYGGQRIGKSSYCLQVLYDIYGDWDTALKYVTFTIEDNIELIKRLRSEKKIIPAFLWDDTGVHANAQMYFKERDLVFYLKAVFDVVGTVTQSVLFSTPDPEGLLKLIRRYEFYRVKIVKRNSHGDRIAKGYQSYNLPSGTKRVRKSFEDYYEAFLPNDIYAKYQILREAYVDTAVESLEGFMGDGKKKRANNNRVTHADFEDEYATGMGYC